jgi:hypothetical protein
MERLLCKVNELEQQIIQQQQKAKSNKHPLRQILGKNSATSSASVRPLPVAMSKPPPSVQRTTISTRSKSIPQSIDTSYDHSYSFVLKENMSPASSAFASSSSSIRPRRVTPGATYPVNVNAVAAHAQIHTLTPDSINNMGTNHVNHAPETATSNNTSHSTSTASRNAMKPLTRGTRAALKAKLMKVKAGTSRPSLQLTN